MLLFALLFAVGAGVAAQQKSDGVEKAPTPGNFLELTRRCEKQLTYRIVSLSTLSDDAFRPYANTTAKSEEDCARKCIERTIFCAAARFFALQNVCQFSAKYIDCSLGHFPQQSSTQNIIHCVQCGAQALPPAARPPPSAVRAGPATVRSNSVAIVPRSFTQPPIPDGPRLRERETIQPFAFVRQLPPVQSSRIAETQQRPLEVPLAPTLSPLSPIQSSRIIQTQQESLEVPLVRTIPTLSPLSLNNFRQAPVLSQFTTDPPPQVAPLKKPPVDEFVDLAVEDSDAKVQHIAGPQAGCSQEMMRPCILGFGRDCNLIKDEITGCAVCACPHKSPARGCAGPQGLKALDRFDMLNGREPCPTDHSVQIVERWYRKVDKNTGVDECYPEKEPYCGWQQDINIWRMPRTKDECNYYCYSNDELRGKGITFFRL
uniref:BPTI-like C-terminal domain-containing protein n=1 Tax=Plectus sambesii TaxID=2011161 RepID=A0A914UK35_9BILA